MSIPSDEKNTIETYNMKSESFIKSRYSRWVEVENFINSLPDSRILDVGCGGGVNMFNRTAGARHRLACEHTIPEKYPVHTWAGCDYSEKLVEHCVSIGLNVTFADMCNLPYEDNQFDAIICVASFHHLSTIERRQKALSEMLRVCNGPIMISVFRDTLECKKVQYIGNNDVIFSFQDAKRYYHLFSKEEFEKLVDKDINVTCKENQNNYYFYLN